MNQASSRKSSVSRPLFSVDHVHVAQVLLVAAFIAGLFLLDGLSRNYATLILQVGDSRRAFQGEVVSGMTILDALNASAQAGQIPLQFSMDADQKTHIVALGSENVMTGTIGLKINGREIAVDDIAVIPVNAQDQIEITMY